MSDIAQIINDEYVESLKKHKARIAELEAANEKLTISNEKLTISNEKLTISNEKLTISNKQLNDINEELDDKIQDLQRDLDSAPFKTDIALLEDKLNKLKPITDVITESYRYGTQLSAKSLYFEYIKKYD